MLESNELERMASRRLSHHHHFAPDTVVAVSLYSYFAVVAVLVAVAVMVGSPIYYQASVIDCP